jgi:hypothetical protein
MCSRNQVIERMFALDYADLFRRFRKGEGFVDVVIETELDPERVRFAYSEYKRGFEEVSRGKRARRQEAFARTRADQLYAGDARLRKVDRSSGWRCSS